MVNYDLDSYKGLDLDVVGPETIQARGAPISNYNNDN